MNRLISTTEIQHRIYLIRDQKVMLDKDLAEIYGIATKRLNEQVKRNRHRFPADFMFQLTEEESAQLMGSSSATLDDLALRSQFATSKIGRGGRRYRPFVFTEHGAVMLACVLKSSIAVKASVQVVRAFNRLKEYFIEHKDLALKLDQVEKRLTVHDHQIQTVFQAIAKLRRRQQRLSPRLKQKQSIGFRK
jgi:hypothetical protein